MGAYGGEPPGGEGAGGRSDTILPPRHSSTFLVMVSFSKVASLS